MSIRVVNSLPEAEWRSFVACHPKGNIFHTPEMFQVFKSTKGNCPELWAAIDDHRVLALFLPVRVSLYDGYLRYLTTRSIVFGSVLCRSDEDGCEALKLLLRTYKHEMDWKSLFTELRNVSPIEELQQILSQEGFIYEDHLNYLIDLDHSPEIVFQNIGKRTRKNIRHGINRAQVIVEEVMERSQLASCYDLLCKTYQAAQVPLADYSLFEAAFDILHPKRMVRFTLARVGDDPAAVSVELLYKDVLYGWYGGMDRTYSSCIPNELLAWHVLKWGAENGYRHYDFGGAGKPDEEYGVRSFKAKFGGKLVCYGRNIWIPRPLLLRVCKTGYETYRRFL